MEEFLWVILEDKKHIFRGDRCICGVWGKRDSGPSVDAGLAWQVFGPTWRLSLLGVQPLLCLFSSPHAQWLCFVWQLRLSRIQIRQGNISETQHR